MKHALVYPEYIDVCRFAHENNPDLRQEYLKTLDSIVSGYSKGLTPDKISVIAFILNRTLKLGRFVADIPFPAFLGGVTSETFQRNITSGINMSKNTLRKVLKELEDDGFLHTFFPVKMRGVMDDFTRYFEIDFKKLQKLTSIGSRVMDMIKTKLEGKLHTPKKDKKTAVDEGKKVNLRLPKMGGLGIIKTHESPSVMYSDEKPVAQDEPEVERIEEPRRSVRRIMRTARPTPAVITQSAEAVAEKVANTVADLRTRLDEITVAAKAKRAAKMEAAKKVTGQNIQMHQMQAIVDDVMTRFYPDLPRMAVVGKPFGAMRSHLKRSSPADIADFVKWTLCAWPRLAQDTSRKARRDTTTAEGRAKPQYAPLPYAPNFSIFAFKMPFFLACYNNQQAINGKMGAPDTRKDDEIARLKKAVVNAHKATESAERVAIKAVSARKDRDTKVTFTHRTEARGQVAAPGHVEDDDLPPVWK